MDTTTHESDLHREVVRKSDRWRVSVLENTSNEVRLSFLGMRDEDLDAMVEELRDREHIEHIDLTFNHLKDAGIQRLVGSLANKKCLPGLKTLRVYKNEFTSLGKQMLSGLKILRKSLEVQIDEPDYFKNKTESGDAAAGA